MNTKRADTMMPEAFEPDARNSNTSALPSAPSKKLADHDSAEVGYTSLARIGYAWRRLGANSRHPLRAARPTKGQPSSRRPDDSYRVVACRDGNRVRSAAASVD